MLGSMPLPELTRSQFDGETERLCGWAVGAVDWAELLGSYSWQGDWRAGLAARMRLADRLHAAAEPDARSSAMEAVVAWGGLKPLGPALCASIAGSLPILDELAF